MVAVPALPFPGCLRIGTLMAIAISFAGCLHGRSPAVLSHPGSGVQIERSQLAGERDLSLLARRATKEDAWLFLNGTWTDVGYDEKPKSVTIDLDVVKAAAERNLHTRSGSPFRQSSRIVFYHVHPLTKDPRMADPLSLSDIHALAAVKKACRLASGLETIGAMLDGRGKWLFDITPTLETRILHDNHSGSSRGVEAPDYAAVRGWIHEADSARSFDLEFPLVAWGALLGDAARTRIERIQTFVRDAETLGVIVTYVER